MSASLLATKLFISLLLDEHITVRLAKQLRARGYETLTAYEAGVDTYNDEPLLEYAVAHGFAIMTQNVKDFRPLHTQFLIHDKHHNGVIIVSNDIGIAELLRRTLALLDQYTAEQAMDQLLFLSNFD